MKVAITTLIAAAALTTTAFTANGALMAERGMLCWATIGFLAAVLVGQTIPALMLLLGDCNKLINRPNAANPR